MLSEAGQTSGMVIGMDGQIEGAISLARTIEVMSRARRSNQTS